jgi:hypothetical protein
VSDTVPVPRLALRKTEAAQVLGVSDETFDRHVAPRLPVVRLGSVRVYPVRAIEAFLASEQAAPVDEIRGRR